MTMNKYFDRNVYVWIHTYFLENTYNGVAIPEQMVAYSVALKAVNLVDLWDQQVEKKVDMSDDQMAVQTVALMVA